MELGAHIKEHRKEKGLSQDDLAEKIYVSRQTISNWETGRTYPDVQSLLLLSNVFEVTVDSLIKGDVEAMAKAVDEAMAQRRACKRPDSGWRCDWRRGWHWHRNARENALLGCVRAVGRLWVARNPGRGMRRPGLRRDVSCLANRSESFTEGDSFRECALRAFPPRFRGPSRSCGWEARCRCRREPAWLPGSPMAR